MTPFDQQRQMFAPLATGTPMPFATGFQNAPLLGGQNPLLQMFGQPLMANMMGQYNMSPMGFPDQNMYDHMRYMKLTQMQGEAMAAAQASDQANYMRIVEAGARMQGKPWDQTRIDAAQQMTGAFAAATPMMAMINPDLVDAMNGRRGSAVVMSQKVFEGGRYRMDPLTGQMGMFGGVNDRNETVTQQLYRQMYEEGDLGRMNGVTAGQMGQIYRDMTLRGMIGTDRSAADLTRDALRDMQLNNSERFRMALDAEGISGVASVDELSRADLSKLARNADVRSQAQTINTDKVRTTLEGYTGAIAAVRDIFGAQGEKAPMAELLNMLDQLSNGSMAQLDPGRLENIVRTTQSLSQMTGITMQGVSVLQQHASAVGASLGLEAPFAVSAMQGAMSYRAAFAGQGLGASTAWGAYNADQATQADLRLRQGAAASASANRAAAFLRAVRYEDLDPNSDLGKYAAALRSASATGATTWEGSNGTNQLNMTTAQIAALMEAGGMDAGRFTSLIGQRYANREVIFENNLQDMSRAAGYETDIRGKAATYLGINLRKGLREGGMSGEEASNVSRAIGANLSDLIIKGMTDEELADTDKRNQKIADMLQSELGATDAGKKLIAQYTDKDGNVDLRPLAASLYGQGDQFMTTLTGMNFNNARDLYNPVTLERAAAARRQAVHRTEMQKAFAPMGQGSPLRNAVEKMISSNDPKLGEIVAAAFGGYDNEQLNAAAEKGLSRIQAAAGDLGKQWDAIQDRDAKIKGMADTPERRRLELEQSKAIERYEAGMNSLNKLSSEVSLDLEKKFGVGEVNTLDKLQEKQEKEVEAKELRINEATIGQLADVLGGIGGIGGNAGEKVLRIVGTLEIDEDGRAEITDAEGYLNDPDDGDVPASG